MSSVKLDGVLKAVKQVRGGVHVNHNKNTADCEVVRIPVPEKVLLPMQQHIGVPCTPTVKAGDKVSVGQIVGDSDKFLSAPIHASISGTVSAVKQATLANGVITQAVEIESDGEMRLFDGLEPPKVTGKESFLRAVRDSGLVGLGGAGFPTHVKLRIPPDKNVDTLIVNAAECEPYITVDYRECLENSWDILSSIYTLKEILGFKRVVIAAEDNKPEAIALFEKKTAADPRVEIVALEKKYPQGGEKQLVDAVTGRQVPAPPAIPVNVGAIVQNVGTAYAVYQAVMKRKPLFERYTTVTGKKLSNPGNFLVRMGTPMRDLIEACGGMPEGENKVLAGGPMMGKSVVSTDVTVCKGTNSITILTDADAHRKPIQPCIRCAKCVSACPMGLEPYLLATLSSFKEWERLEAEQVTSCISCGSCQFTCPSHRPILDNILQGKGVVMGIIKSRNAKK